MLDLWYTENHTDNVKFSIKTTEHILTEKTPFQQIDFFKSLPQHTHTHTHNWDTWVAQLVKHLLLAQVMILDSWD